MPNAFLGSAIRGRETRPCEVSVIRRCRAAVGDDSVLNRARRVASVGWVVGDVCLVLLTGALGKNSGEAGAIPGNLIGG